MAALMKCTRITRRRRAQEPVSYDDSSIYGDGDLVTGSSQIAETDGSAGRGRYACGHAKIHLIVSRIAGSVTKEQDFRHPVPDKNLRWNCSSANQSRGVHRENLSCVRGCARGSSLPGDGVPDGALSHTVAG